MVLLSRGLLALSVLVVLVVGVAGTVDAHAALIRSDPPAGAVLPEAPATIRLWFTEPLETRFTRAQVLDATGAPIAGVTSAIALEDDHQLVVTLPADLPDGGYTVAWRNLSAADGHTLEGYFGFSVGTGAVADSPSVMAASPANDTARALTRALALIGLSALLAIAPVTLGVLDPTARAVPGLADRLRPHLRRYAVVAAGTALLGSIAALAAQALTIVPEAALLTAMAETLTSTRYGQLWLPRLLGLLLVTVAVVAALWGRPSWRRAALVAGTVIGLGVPIPFSLMSHAAAQPQGTTAAVAADALHLLAVAIWGGGLFLLAVVLAPALRPFSSGTWREAVRVAIPRFSVLGLAAWGILWLSGLYSAWLQVGSIAAVTHTPYGQSLLLKGVVLIPVLVLAAWHFRLGWRGTAGAEPRRGAATFAAEALLVVAVLLVVGRLIGQEPAREIMAQRTPTQLQAPLVFATDEGERAGQLLIAPGAAGVNTFTLELAGAPVPKDAEAVLRFALPSQTIGQQELRLPQVGPNRFAAEGSELALGGDWQLTTVVRAIGVFSWSTRTTVTVGVTPPSPPVVNPAPVFGAVGIAGMLLVAMGVVALAAAVATREASTSRRGSAAGVGVIAIVAGLAILAGARIPGGASGPALSQMAPSRESAPASPTAMLEHEHAMATPDVPGVEALPGIGTPVGENRLVVTLDGDANQPGPTDFTLTVRDETGAPVPGARVVVFAEMPGMGGDTQGISAVEEESGRYRVDDVPLSMSGPWQVTARISPKSQPTTVTRFALDVGE